MKKLVITYGDMTLYEGDVAELTWQESGSGVKVEGRQKPSKGAGAGGILEVLGSGLASASKAKTERMVEEKTADD